MVVIVGASRDKPMPPCLTANSPRGGAGGGGRKTNKQTNKEFFTDSPILHAKFSIKYMTHSIQKGLEVRKNKCKWVSKINPIKNIPFTAVAKRWEESSNSNKEII